MSEQRLRLDSILRRVLQETVGEIHLYYQPPANLKMQYPCIRYDLNRIRNVHGDGDDQDPGQRPHSGRVTPRPVQTRPLLYCGQFIPRRVHYDRLKNKKEEQDL